MTITVPEGAGAEVLRGGAGDEGIFHPFRRSRLFVLCLSMCLEAFFDVDFLKVAIGGFVGCQ